MRDGVMGPVTTDGSPSLECCCSRRIQFLPHCRRESAIGVYQQDYRRDGLGPMPSSYITIQPPATFALDTSPVISTPKLSRGRVHKRRAKRASKDRPSPTD